MNSNTVSSTSRVPHPPGFRARRGVNWGAIGLLTWTIRGKVPQNEGH